MDMLRKDGLKQYQEYDAKINRASQYAALIKALHMKYDYGGWRKTFVYITANCHCYVLIIAVILAVVVAELLTVAAVMDGRKSREIRKNAMLRDIDCVVHVRQKGVLTNLSDTAEKSNQNEGTRHSVVEVTRVFGSQSHAKCKHESYQYRTISDDDDDFVDFELVVMTD
ncbi:hypothetical protein GQX74_004267 [Glossina fuscipes]|nr:hypothetical protein GQX74_004267 [Glossina fuscipes]